MTSCAQLWLAGVLLDNNKGLLHRGKRYEVFLRKITSLLLLTFSWDFLAMRKILPPFSDVES